MITAGRTGMMTGTFRPSQLSNLALWLDAADTATITAIAGRVSQWSDKSGNGCHSSQSTDGYQPVTTTINGLNALLFDGTDDYLNVGSGAYSIPNGANTLFTVYKTAVSSQQRILNGLIAGGTGTRWGQLVTDYPSYGITGLNDPAAYTPVTKTTAADTNTHVGVTRFAGGAGGVLSVYNNGGSPVTGTTTGNISTIDMMLVGRGPTITAIFNGAICEIVAYNRALSDAELNLVGVYLSKKWGVTWEAI